MEPELPRRVKVEVGEDGILRAVYGIGADVTEQDAREVLAWVTHHCSKRKRPLLADTAAINSMDRGARQIFADSDAPAAVAVIVRTKPARVIGNFFLGLNRPKVPMKLFSDDEAALQWLREYV